MGKSYQEFASVLEADVIAAIRGKVTSRDDGLTVHAYSVTLPDVSSVQQDAPLTLSLAEARATERVLGELREILDRHKGPSQVRLQLVTGSSVRMFELPYLVSVNADLFGEVKGLLGPQCLA
jgi:DNA polymerase-3 subunit alpha